jgi:hypothetical protein
MDILFIISFINKIKIRVSYGYDRQHKNKAEYLRVKTKSDVDMCLTSLI